MGSDLYCYCGVVLRDAAFAVVQAGPSNRIVFTSDKTSCMAATLDYMDLHLPLEGIARWAAPELLQDNMCALHSLKAASHPIIAGKASNQISVC